MEEDNLRELERNLENMQRHEEEIADIMNQINRNADPLFD
jgi:chromosome segregation ATPase